CGHRHRDLRRSHRGAPAPGERCRSDASRDPAIQPAPRAFATSRLWARIAPPTARTVDEKTRPAQARGAGRGCDAARGAARVGQCDEAVAAPTPVWARTYWSSKASFSASAALLLSSVENSQVMKNAIGIENSAGWV